MSKLARVRLVYLLWLCAAVSPFQNINAQDKGHSRPNILFILTDDQGWTSLSSYGNRLVATEHLDRLASEGVRFTNAYVMPQCTPTRAALLTGMHTARNGMWHVIAWYGSPWARVAEPPFVEQLPPQQCRLTHSLRAAGYKTGMAGKWHLTNSDYGHYANLTETGAEVFGFDFVAPPGPGSQNEGDKWVDHLTDAACRFMEQHRDHPWFFYLAHHTLHGTVSAPQNLIQKYEQMGAPRVGLNNATYLAAIEHLDSSIGRLMQKLDDLGLSENTLVVFLSDNGGLDTSYAVPDTPLGLSGQSALRVRLQEFPNDPLRDGKGSPYEGGIRVPCIVRWPERIPNGRIEDTPIHVVDWYPTLLEAAGTPSIDLQDGVSLVSLLCKQIPLERTLYWYMPLYDLRWAATPVAVVRKGPWKLIYYFGDWFDRNQVYHAGSHVELFNLETDISEQIECSTEHPELVQTLQQDLVRWIKSTGAVVPDANPHFDAERQLLETKQKQAWNP